MLGKKDTIYIPVPEEHVGEFINRIIKEFPDNKTLIQAEKRKKVFFEPTVSGNKLFLRFSILKKESIAFEKFVMNFRGGILGEKA